MYESEIDLNFRSREIWDRDASRESMEKAEFEKILILIQDGDCRGQMRPNKQTKKTPKHDRYLVDRNWGFILCKQEDEKNTQYYSKALIWKLEKYIWERRRKRKVFKEEDDWIKV